MLPKKQKGRHPAGGSGLCIFVAYRFSWAILFLNAQHLLFIGLTYFYRVSFTAFW